MKKNWMILFTVLLLALPVTVLAATSSPATNDSAKDPYYTMGHTLNDNPDINSIHETVDPFSVSG